MLGSKRGESPELPLQRAEPACAGRVVQEREHPRSGALVATLQTHVQEPNRQTSTGRIGRFYGYRLSPPLRWADPPPAGVCRAAPRRHPRARLGAGIPGRSPIFLC